MCILQPWDLQCSGPELNERIKWSVISDEVVQLLSCTAIVADPRVTIDVLSLESKSKPYNRELQLRRQVWVWG